MEIPDFAVTAIEVRIKGSTESRRILVRRDGDLAFELGDYRAGRFPRIEFSAMLNNIREALAEKIDKVVPIDLAEDTSWVIIPPPAVEMNLIHYVEGMLNIELEVLKAA